jgi:hypothetical protein
VPHSDDPSAIQHLFVVRLLLLYQVLDRVVRGLVHKLRVDLALRHKHEEEAET